MPSMIWTPWPSRSAPHHWIACRIDGRRDDLRALLTGAGRVCRVGVLAVEEGVRAEFFDDLTHSRT